MGGTREGGIKARAKLLKDNPNYYSDLAKKARKPRGGAATPGSFANDPARAAKAGSKGGKASGLARRARSKSTGVKQAKPALPSRPNQEGGR